MLFYHQSSLPLIALYFYGFCHITNDLFRQWISDWLIFVEVGGEGEQYSELSLMFLGSCTQMMYTTTRKEGKTFYTLTSTHTPPHSHTRRANSFYSWFIKIYQLLAHLLICLSEKYINLKLLYLFILINQFVKTTTQTYTLQKENKEEFSSNKSEI